MSSVEPRRGITRRELLGIGMAGGLAALYPIGRLAGVFGKRLDLIEEVERRACLYFWEQAHPDTGLVLDRAPTGQPSPLSVAGNIASIAATGFGLSALAISSSRGYLRSGDALARAQRTLECLVDHVAGKNGFFYHFVDVLTGDRCYECEVSSVDTAWLLCGVIHARQHFDTPAIRRLADEILGRVDWKWMWAGGPTLSHGWTPEGGFLPYRWDRYSELLAMYLLAMASDSYPIPPLAWNAWTRPRQKNLAPGQVFVESLAPLFAHQYSHAWVDFRGLRDGSIDYFENSRMATVLHREFCVSLRGRFPWFSESMWGITSSESPYGYIDWGGLDPVANSHIDGTLVPCAAGGSIVFLPQNCTLVLETMLERYGNRCWTRYGFVDAFHPLKWRAPDVVGIDLGIMLLMAENHRTGSVWKAMMAAPEVQRGLAAARFTKSKGLDG
ncbi:MAG TPA: glucoamylase family protein [Bryobacteraceae bacterium]|nr:glucoamylase family protein [Bryobacteraceae bacterium]